MAAAGTKETIASNIRRVLVGLHRLGPPFDPTSEKQVQPSISQTLVDAQAEDAEVSRLVERAYGK